MTELKSCCCPLPAVSPSVAMWMAGLCVRFQCPAADASVVRLQRLGHQPAAASLLVIHAIIGFGDRFVRAEKVEGCMRSFQATRSQMVDVSGTPNALSGIIRGVKQYMLLFSSWSRQRSCAGGMVWKKGRAPTV